VSDQRAEDRNASAPPTCRLVLSTRSQMPARSAGTLPTSSASRSVGQRCAKPDQHRQRDGQHDGCSCRHNADAEQAGRHQALSGGHRRARTEPRGDPWYDYVASVDRAVIGINASPVAATDRPRTS